MFNHFNSTRAEWRHLFTNKVLLISSIVMFVIPILYGGFFLGSIWDPYGNTSKLPVAVVNDDKAVSYNGKTLHIGNDIVANLKTNHDIKWEFVSADAATQGLANGHYYMSITLPSDFSKNATSVTTSTPQKSTLLYTVTPSKNYVGSLISEQAANKVVANVTQTITHEYVDTILGSVTTLRGGIAQAADGSSQLATGASTLSRGVTTYTQGVATVANGQQSLVSGITQLQSGVTAMSQGITAVNSALPTDAQIAQLTDGITQIQQGLTALRDSSASPAAGSTGATVQKNAAETIAAIQAYQELAATPASTSAVKVIGELAYGAATTGSPTTTVQTADIQTLLALVSQGGVLAQKSGALLQSVQTLNTELSTATSQLATGMNTLSPQLSTALRGYTSVRTANTQLLSGTAQLTHGVNQLLLGSTQLTSGTQQLTANSDALTQGAQELSSGSATLAYKLSDASTQLSRQQTGESVASQIVSPVSEQKTEKGTVPNYGFALSPYVLALGLYVGALVFTVIYPVRSRYGAPTSGFDWFVAKFGAATVVGIGQVIVLAGVMTGVLGLRPVDSLGFIALLLATSFTFMSITMLLAVTLNNPGRFIAMLLLVFQLGGAEGVFPLETLPAFFRVINPFLPMTYAIRGLREAISGSVGGQTVLGNLAIVLVFGVIAQLILYLALTLHYRHPFSHTAVVAE